MPRHYMIDIETWDTAPTAVIRAIAIVGFDLDGGTRGLNLIDCRRIIDEQIQAGRTTSEETAAWWAKQPIRLDSLLMNTRSHVADTLTIQPLDLPAAAKAVQDALWTEDHDIRVWSRGHFDIAILMNLLAAHGRPIPWRYSQVRDVRTLDEITPPIKAAMPHHPLADCLAQIQQVCAALRMAKAVAQAVEAVQDGRAQ